jgi:hypothetical protein
VSILSQCYLSIKFYFTWSRINEKFWPSIQAPVAHTYNPTIFLGGKDWEDHGSRPTCAKKIHETPLNGKSVLYSYLSHRSKIIRAKRGGSIVQAEECLPSKCEVLSWNSLLPKKDKPKKFWPSHRKIFHLLTHVQTENLVYIVLYWKRKLLFVVQRKTKLKKRIGV